MCVFLTFDLCRVCVVFRFFILATTANDLRLCRIFYLRFYPLHYFLILIFEKEPFQCWVLNKGTSLVWRGPWLGIEPGTSRTRCQHSTTRLSRRRLKRIVRSGPWLPFIFNWVMMCTFNRFLSILFPKPDDKGSFYVKAITFCLSSTFVP